MIPVSHSDKSLLLQLENAGLKRLQKLGLEFYQRQDVVQIARDLIGKILVTNFDHQLCAGRIVETEAYNGIHDRAAHSYNNRRTKRTEVMYAAGGVAYVYLCYGLHHMFNVVAGPAGKPNAVLIRAVEPLAGVAAMLKRCGKSDHKADLTKGPGNVGKAFGFHSSQSGLSLMGEEVFVATSDSPLEMEKIVTTTRIGVDYAGEDALLPYRFYLKTSKYVSGKKQVEPKVP